MKITKMHNAGNDYIYVEQRDLKKNCSLSELARNLSHRRFGIGSDGLVVMNTKEKTMRMFNQDGSESAMCGNAIFCVAKYFFERKFVLEKKFFIKFAKKKYPVEVFLKGKKINKVKITLPKPSLKMGSFFKNPSKKKQEEFLDYSFNFDNLKLTGSLIALKNPHFVVFVENLKKVPVQEWGTLIEKHSFFPQGINIEFVELVHKGKVLQRTWERGSGETWACGSGACAVCTAGYLTGRTNRILEVQLLGGSIVLDYQEEYLQMLGHPVEVFCTKIDI